VLTRNSGPRLARLLDEVSSFADEILVGVDAGSTDNTLDVAIERADKVFRFRHSGQMAPARMLPFRYASGDWILSLDDDESIDDNFDALLGGLMTNDLVTHYWFKRKCVVSLNPCEYVHGLPWYPDWQLRMFRNDIRLVWKPPIPHSGYNVLGIGCREERASIFHFEPLIVTDEARRAKVLAWREAGATSSTESRWPPAPDIPRRPARLRSRAAPPDRTRKAICDMEIHEASTPPASLWRAEIVRCDHPQIVPPNTPFLMQTVVRNVSDLAWFPGTTAFRSTDLKLSCHIRTDRGKLVKFDGPRFPIPRIVWPGEEVTFACVFPRLKRPGKYLIEWDMVNDGKGWFKEFGCGTLVSRIDVARRSGWWKKLLNFDKAPTR